MVGRRESATTVPPTSTTTWRLLGRMSTRLYGSLGWTKTSSSSSNQWSAADHLTETWPVSSASDRVRRLSGPRAARSTSSLGR